MSSASMSMSSSMRVRMPSVHGSAPKQPALSFRSFGVSPASRIDSPK